MFFKTPSSSKTSVVEIVAKVLISLGNLRRHTRNSSIASGFFALIGNKDQQKKKHHASKMKIPA